MLEEKQTTLDNLTLPTFPKMQKIPAMACPLCCGEWISLGGLSKCMKCGFIYCVGCGDNLVLLGS